MPNYLTKSKFTHCLNCPTKLYYATNAVYKSTLEDNDFLEALAKGGIQVGELAKIYYPGGTKIDTLNYDESLYQTKELLKQDDVIVYEGAVRYEKCFIRVDIIEKKGSRLNLIEVKSKSWGIDDDFTTKKKGTIRSEWQKYLYDVAFQYWVMQQALPEHQIEPYLMMIDKSQQVTVSGLHQKFKVVNENGRYKVKVKPGITAKELGDQILIPVHVIDEVEIILMGNGRDPQSEPEAAGFKSWIEILCNHLQSNDKYPVCIGKKCKQCEYRIGRNKLDKHEKSGFEECWKKYLKWNDEDFEKPHVFDIWNERKLQDILDKEVFLMEELIPEMLPANPENLYELTEWNDHQRKTVQIMKATGYHPYDEAMLPGLFEEMKSWIWPLHFIDFEAVLAAIPFHQGLYPYEHVPFQFSCHTLYEEGRLEHRYNWIEEKPGKLPNIEFARQLKKCLEGDNGTVFRYHNFENIILDKTVDILKRLQPDDEIELIEWIQTLTKGGVREMVDQHRLTKKYYYSPHMQGSISIKDVLPAVLTESNRLQEIYSKPYSGLYLKDKIFYKPDPETGKAISPYKLLNPIGHGIPDYEEADKLMGEEIISEGGSAMIAWSRIQFDDVSGKERKAILQSLYEYCELDTLAMVMIHQHWEELRDSI